METLGKEAGGRDVQKFFACSSFQHVSTVLSDA